MSNLNTFIRIPKERVGVLIGPEGKVKQDIEERLQIKLEIESDAGGVEITLDKNATDPSTILRAKDVVTAIGRGFSPDQAFRLIRNEEAIFDFVDLRLIFGRSDSDIRRVKSRIIGMNGKTRRTIEELTEADVVVYGHTVGFIGEFDEVEAARSAVQMIIQGSEHHTVYNFLQKKRRELKKQRLELWEKPKEY
ncbi:MAG: KH domain-containing protein [Candidatus Bathyarchaeota archaeon]|nr:KH domain-containing protein [Candidatus Bathyarchaeota archaeon]